MFAGTALSVRLLVYAGLSLFIISGPYLYVVVYGWEYPFIEYETLRSVSQIFCHEVVLRVLGDFVAERVF